MNLRAITDIIIPGRVTIVKGEQVNANDPLVKGREHFFEPVKKKPAKKKPAKKAK